MAALGPQEPRSAHEHGHDHWSEYGSVAGAISRRRTRYDPPALNEAIAAAQGLTEQIEGQIAIAAQLMGLPEDEVRPEVLKAATQTNAHNTGSTYVRQRRTEVVVERRNPRIPRR